MIVGTRRNDERRIDVECDVAGMVYRPDDNPNALLMHFASKLTALNCRVVGLLQRGQCSDRDGLNVTLLPSRRTMRLSPPRRPHPTS